MTEYSLLIAAFIWAALSTGQAVEKPTGVFASSGATGDAIYENPQLQGVLVRTSWSSLEPSPGSFDFTSIDQQVSRAQEKDRDWSLAVIAGGLGSPDWLLDDLEADFIPYSFRGEPGYRLPLIWDSIVQGRLKILAEALADEYGSSPSLKLVYVSQMSSNGIEGHLQGVDMLEMVRAGYTDERWIAASISNARNFALAFEEKALAFEVHDINNSAEVPMAIIDALWQDSELQQRVGAAVWWLSGKTTYQPELLAALTAFPGDIYAQLIANSSQPDRFGENDISTAFEQAKSLGVRYIEPWEYEFKYTNVGANGAWDPVMEDFNTWAAASFQPAVSLQPLTISFTSSHLVISGDDVSESIELLQSSDLLQWNAVEDALFQATEPPSLRIERESALDTNTQFFRIRTEAAD